MTVRPELKDKIKILSECQHLGLPVYSHDELKALELIHTLATTNNLQYAGDGSERDKIIENIIDRIRRYVKKSAILTN